MSHPATLCFANAIAGDYWQVGIPINKDGVWLTNSDPCLSLKLKSLLALTHDTFFSSTRRFHRYVFHIPPLALLEYHNQPLL